MCCLAHRNLAQCCVRKCTGLARCFAWPSSCHASSSVAAVNTSARKSPGFKDAALLKMAACRNLGASLVSWRPLGRSGLPNMAVGKNKRMSKGKKGGKKKM